jgi:hypothetical protein
MAIRFDLTNVEKKALEHFAAKYGRTWKAVLLEAWFTRFGLRGEPYEEALRRLQHVLGETGLERIEVDVPRRTKPEPKRRAKR